MSRLATTPSTCSPIAPAGLATSMGGNDGGSPGRGTVDVVNDDYFKVFRDLQTWGDGKQYGLMYDGDAHQFYFRKDILRKRAWPSSTRTSRRSTAMT